MTMARLRRAKCSVCGKDVAVTQAGLAHPHGRKRIDVQGAQSHRLEPSGCPGSGCPVIDPSDEGTISGIPQITRRAIADEIRSMRVPSHLEATLWRDVAAFVERSGDWVGYEL